jgi:hypothetical protein
MDDDGVSLSGVVEDAFQLHQRQVTFTVTTRFWARP